MCVSHRCVPEKASSALGSEFLASKRGGSGSGAVLVDRRYQRRDCLFDAEPGGWFLDLVGQLAALGRVVTRDVPGLEVYSSLHNVCQLSQGVEEAPRVGAIFPLPLIIRECEELYGVGILVTGGKPWAPRGYLVSMLRGLGYGYSVILDAYMSALPLIGDRYSEGLLQAVDSVVFALHAWVDAAQGAGAGAPGETVSGFNIEQAELLQAIRSQGVSQWCDSLRGYLYAISSQQPTAAVRALVDRHSREVRGVEQRILGLVMA